MTRTLLFVCLIMVAGSCGQKSENKPPSDFDSDADADSSAMPEDVPPDYAIDFEFAEPNSKEMFEGVFIDIESGAPLNFKTAGEFDNLCIECALAYGLEVDIKSTGDYSACFYVDVLEPRPWKGDLRYKRYIGQLTIDASRQWRYISRWAGGTRFGLVQLKKSEWPRDLFNELSFVQCLKKWPPALGPQPL